MTPADQLDLAAAARTHVARVITLLEHPTVSALHESSAELSVAIARTEELQGGFAGRQIASPAKAVMVALRKDLWRAGRLLSNAWELRIGRGSQVEYTEKGEWARQPLFTVRWALKA
jgi:hypothetical protein